jgi:hypothetical protein
VSFSVFVRAQFEPSPFEREQVGIDAAGGAGRVLIGDA